MGKIPKSVSQTYYEGVGNWFTYVFFISALLICIGLINLSEGSPFQFIGFFTGAGLAFVGCAPKFHEDLEGTVHTVAAVILLVGSQAWVCIFSTPRVLVLWIAMAYLYTKPQRTFWLEVMCLITLSIGLILIN